jgi:hypothetical protein
MKLAFSSMLRGLLLPAALSMGVTLAACQGCRGSAGATPQATTPTARLYLISTVAGALEPCGCSKNQLGGFDHFAAFVASEAKKAPNSVVAGAGPMFFLDPELKPDHAQQDQWKADAIADTLAKLPFVGWAPGANDWAGGAPRLGELATRSKGVNLAANVAGGTTAVVREVGGIKIGFVGVSVPKRTGIAPAGVEVKAPREALAAGIADAKAKGATVLVGLFAMQRGEALRLVELTPELSVAAIGKAFDQGEGNDKPATPAMLGKTLVVETANHLQTAAIVDLYVRDGQIVFQDAAGIANAGERASLEKRIADLKLKITAWEQVRTIDPKDLAQRRADLAKAEEELRRLETPPPPDKGSFFRFTSIDVKTELGRDEPTFKEMLEYYDQVNEHNKRVFADRKPPPPGPDGNAYIGIDECTKCHAAARAVWDKTPHANAYSTIAVQHKEFNLDCVSCHVTGYEKPGGSTITHVEKLKNVQCEECHGPGAKHRDKPADKALVIGHPKTDMCVSACHHPPHVEGFDPGAQLARILGPGHGMPVKLGTEEQGTAAHADSTGTPSRRAR